MSGAARDQGGSRARGLAVLGLALGCGAGAAVWLTRDHSLDRLRERGVIRIGYAIEAPYAYLEAGRAVPAGESPAVAAAIVSRLGIPAVDWRQCEFPALIDELEAGRIDVIAAGMFVTPERARRIAFSRPTVQVRPALLVARGNPRDLHGYGPAAAAPPPPRLAAISGSVEEGLLLAQDGVTVVAVPDAATGRAAVETGAVDGLALSAPTIRWMASHDLLGATEIADPFQGPPQARDAGLVAFGFRQGDRALRAAWDAVLSEFLGSAEHLALVEGLGFRAEDLPGSRP